MTPQHATTRATRRAGTATRRATGVPAAHCEVSAIEVIGYLGGLPTKPSGQSVYEPNGGLGRSGVDRWGGSEGENDSGVDHDGIAGGIVTIAEEAGIGDVVVADADLEAVADVVKLEGGAEADAGEEVEA